MEGPYGDASIDDNKISAVGASDSGKAHLPTRHYAEDVLKV